MGFGDCCFTIAARNPDDTLDKEKEVELWVEERSQDNLLNTATD